MQSVFNRYEKKYILPQSVYLALRQDLAQHMKPDEYGQHTICNIYYDTPDHLLVRRSIERPVYKEKLRLRSYGVPDLDSKVFLEIKKKYRKVVNKRRVAMTLREAYDYLERGIRPSCEGQILREIDFLLGRHTLARGLYLAYDRIALAGIEDPAFRVTFDTRIRSRRSDMGLECGDSGEHLLPRGYYLMETKIMGSTPKWFSALLAKHQIYPASFSKYGNIYKKEHDNFDFDAMMLHRHENLSKERTYAC